MVREATILNEKSPCKNKGFLIGSDRARIRTWDRLLRRQVLYPTELRDRFRGANITYFIFKTRFFLAKIENKKAVIANCLKFS